VDVVLGVSMAPTKVRMVLVEGESADGACVDQDDFDVAVGSPSTAPAQVLSALLGTRESAVEGGYQLLSSGVTWTDPIEAAALRDALAAHKIGNVMLVSAFLAAAALAQAVGNATGYARTALLFVEPYTATLAVVNTADGSVIDMHRKRLPDDDDQALANLVEVVAGAEFLNTRPEGVFVVGSGVDIPMIKPRLEAATSLALSVPEEPEMALAQGAALASANAPLFAASTAARAYALDRGTDDGPENPPYLVAADTGDIDNVAYSTLSDDADGARPHEHEQRRRPALLIGSSLSVVAISAVVALELVLAISIRPTVALRPSPNENIIVPTAPAPAPAIVPEPEVVRAPTPVEAPRPSAPRVLVPPVAPPPVVVPPAPPPVVIPIAPRAPAPPPRLVPRVPVPQPRSVLPQPQIPRPGALLPRPRLPIPGLGGRGPFGGLPFGGGRGGLGGIFGRR
jgi:hypothetical protein